MNKILVDNKIKDIISSNIIIDNNNIFIKESGEYYITYNNIDNNIIVNIDNNINVIIYIISNNISMNNKIIYNIKSNSNLTISKFYYSKNINEDIIINIDKDSKINYYFSSFTNYNNNYNIKVYHKDINSISNISNHILCNKNGIANIIIDSYASKGVSGSILNQDTKIINLDENKSMIKPNMYIDEEDIEAKHSSCVGTFNEEDMFYLKSRGINDSDAIKLLSKGFIISNLYINKEFKELINNIINKGVII